MRLRMVIMCVLLTVLCVGMSLAQTTSGSVAGNVNDPNQASVSGATVVIADEAKGFSQRATTDKEGRFVFPQLPPGTYTLSIEATGFKKMQRSGIALVANDKLTLGDLVLEVGATSETVTVTGEATQVQAESAERSYAIQGAAVQNIAVNGRGFTPLASLAPGIVFQGPNNGSSDNLAQISANGLRMNNNSLQLDGVSIMDTGNNGTLLNISLDSIAEFKILTANYQAEYGRSAGAQISAVTRGGAKDFHGSFYTFRRHDGMNANTWINNRDSTDTNRINKPRLDQRDIGYTISGPVYIPKVFNTDKQKLFFFFSQEHQKRFIPPASQTRVTVPTALERAGDFSKSVDNSGNPFPYIRDSQATGLCQATPANPTPGVNYQAACFQDGGVLGKIPANRLYGLGLNILKMYPLPNTAGFAGYNYVTESPTNQPERQDLIRIDYNLSNAWRVSGRYVKDTSNRLLGPPGSFVLANNLPDYPTKYLFPRYSFSTTATGSLNSTTILELTFGQSHNSIDILPGTDKFTRQALGLAGFPTIFPGAVQLDQPPRFCFGGPTAGLPNCGGGRISNSPIVGSNNAPFTNFNTVRNMVASLSKIWGQHTLKTGIFWENSFKPQSSFANNNGTIDFSNNASNPLDTGFGFANAAIGVYNTYQQASGYFIGKYRYNNLEWYAQDNWKVTNRLTLDYGARFYLIQPQYDEDLQTANFIPTRYVAADAPRLYRPGKDAAGNRIAIDPVTGQTLSSVYIGRIVPNSGKLLNGVVQAGAGIEKGLYRNRGVHFAPRFGFAYDVTGRQSLVVRGGGGVFYDRPQGNVVFDLLTNPPTTIQPTFNFGRLQDIGSGQLLLAPPSLVAYDRQGKSPTTYAFNIGVQYKLPLESVLDVSYVGTLGEHLLQRRNINAPAYGAAYLPQNQDTTQNPSLIPGATALTTDFLRPFQGFGTIQFIEPASSSNYHSLQTSVNRRFQKGLLLGVNYTWSKALGTQAADLPGVNGFGAPRGDGNQRRANYAPQDFDRRHNFNINWVYELPKATQNRKLGYALNDWQLSGIYRYQSGQPYNIGFSVPGSAGYSLTGTQDVEGARIVLLGNPGSGNSGDPYRQFNTAAFTIPRPGSMALESGRNFLNRAPINNWDLSLTKRFAIKERAKIELRLDAFNALNHTQFDAVNTTLNVVGFNAATGVLDPTPTNLPFDSSGRLVNKNGFGTISSVRPPRNLQLSAHIQF